MIRITKPMNEKKIFFFVKEKCTVAEFVIQWKGNKKKWLFRWSRKFAIKCDSSWS
jgi:hypothetical protein